MRSWKIGVAALIGVALFAGGGWFASQKAHPPEQSANAEPPAIVSEPVQQRIQAGDGKYEVYWAGELFSAHHLTGNVALKKEVTRLSGGKYLVKLPQSRSPQKPDAALIRNADLFELVTADAAVFCYEGAELDSGTVVEYMHAKLGASMPCVLLRTDCRRMEKGVDEPYNLMNKSFPRTVEVHLPVLFLYQEKLAKFLAETKDGSAAENELRAEEKAIRAVNEEVASRVVEALGKAIEIPCPIPMELREPALRLLPHTVGSGFEKLLTPEKIDELLRRKRKLGVL